MKNLSQYAQVNDLVCQVTTNKTLQTFFMLYLMTDDSEQKESILADFKTAWQQLPPSDLLAFKQDFTSSFKKILPFAKTLHSDILTYKKEFQASNSLIY